MNKATCQTRYGPEKIFQDALAHAVEVRGWIPESSSVERCPAVIVNPDANPLSLLSWGIDQLQQCNALLKMLGDVEESPAHVGRLADSALHFLLQAETVLHAGIEMLVAQQSMSAPVSEYGK
ncbi:hypothetical protein ACO2Q9_11220 [Variovorax sp. VNK109]|uniref:hypothetical protein n=1 Tax=Variovorax sp. VNK109 TaxID=3400919 RepID=UPI003C0576A0